MKALVVHAAPLNVVTALELGAPAWSLSVILMLQKTIRKKWTIVLTVPILTGSIVHV
nr:hypothetical protein [Pseudomonas syringae pv. actinidiae]